MLDMLSGQTDVVVPKACIAAELADGIAGDEALAEKAVSVQLLEPLAIDHIGFTAREMFHIGGTDETDINTCLFKEIMQSHPIHPGRLHCDGGDTMGAKILNRLMIRDGKRTEALDGLTVDGNEQLLAAHINTCSMELHLRQGRHVGSSDIVRETLMPGPETNNYNGTLPIGIAATKPADSP